MTEEPLGPVVKLSDEHELAGFDCGVEALNRWLADYALLNQRGHGAVTYVVCRQQRVVGYYALAAHQVTWQAAPDRLGRGLARHPIPAVLLARLAIDQTEQGQGLGAELLRDALVRAAGAAEVIGARAVIVDAKDEAGVAFYRRFDFEPFPDHPRRLYVLMKDLAPLVADALEDS